MHLLSKRFQIWPSREGQRVVGTNGRVKHRSALLTVPLALGSPIFHLRLREVSEQLIELQDSASQPFGLDMRAC